MMPSVLVDGMFGYERSWRSSYVASAAGMKPLSFWIYVAAGVTMIMVSIVILPFVDARGR